MRFLDRYHNRKGGDFATVAVETAEYAAASFAFGYAQNRWRDKAQIAGIPADLAAGGLLKLVAMFGGGFVRGGLHSLVDNVGNAGIGAFFHTYGAGMGAQKSGLTRLLIKSSDLPAAKKALPNAQVLGAIPPAPRGDFLSAAELAKMANG